MILETQDSLSQVPIPPSFLRLDYTLKCGQVFRWENLNGGYVGFVNFSPVYVRQEVNGFSLLGNADRLSKVTSYFRLDDPLDDITRAWKDDRILSEAAKTFRGLRLIHQEAWSCLVGFVLSIMSNIPKIETGLGKLARHCGERVRFLGSLFYATPSPKALSSLREKTLRSFGIGFRAPYLKECAREVTRGFSLEELASLPYLEAKRALMELPGIGEKVADCILLHGLGHLEAFPVDVWMKRVLEHYYFKGEEKTERYLSEWGRNKFGPWAGYAELYLYTFGRWKLDPRSPFRGKR